MLSAAALNDDRTNELHKRRGGFFTENLGNATAQQFPPGSHEEFLVLYPDIQTGAGAIEFKNELVDRFNKRAQARFAFAQGSFGSFVDNVLAGQGPIRDN